LFDGIGTAGADGLKGFEGEFAAALGGAHLEVGQPRGGGGVGEHEEQIEDVLVAFVGEGVRVEAQGDEAGEEGAEFCRERGQGRGGQGWRRGRGCLEGFWLGDCDHGEIMIDVERGCKRKDRNRRRSAHKRGRLARKRAQSWLMLRGRGDAEEGTRQEASGHRGATCEARRA
jgi:hypothetical protein